MSSIEARLREYEKRDEEHIRKTKALEEQNAVLNNELKDIKGRYRVAMQKLHEATDKLQHLGKTANRITKHVIRGNKDKVKKLEQKYQEDDLALKKETVKSGKVVEAMRIEVVEHMGKRFAHKLDSMVLD